MPLATEPSSLASHELLEHLAYWLLGVVGLGVAWYALRRWAHATESALVRLAESEARFREIHQTMPLGYQSLDADGRLILVNAAWLEMTGYAENEVIGHRFGDFLTDDSAELLRQRLAESGGIHGVECSLRCRNGEVKVLKLAERVARDARGRAVRTDCVVRDVTAAKHLAAQLQQQVDTFNALLGTSLDGVVQMDGSGRIIAVNDAYCRLTGYDREDLLRLTIQELEAIETRDEVERHMARVRRKGGGRFDTRHRTKGGGAIDLEISVTFVPSLARFVAFCHDVSLRKKLEMETRTANVRLSALVSSLRMGVLVTNAERRIVVVNETFCRLFEIAGGTRALIGTECAAAVRELGRLFADPAQFARRVDELLASREPCLAEPLQLADGRVLERDCVPVADAGEGPGTLWVYRDVTSRRRMEEAMERRLIALTRPLDVAEGITFEDLFNVTEIQRLQDLFSTATGVASLITRPDGTPITRPSNFTRCCMQVIRGTEKGLCNCIASDAALGRPDAGGPVVQRCLSGGLWDAGVTITVGGRHVASWLIGQVRNETQTDEQMRAYARAIGASEDELVTAFHEVPSMSVERFRRIADTVFTLAQQLSASAYQNIQQARFITERNRAQQALDESQQQFRATIEHSGAGYFRLGEDHRFEAVNSAWLRMHGLTSEQQIIGQHFSVTQVPAHQADAEAIVLQAFAGREFSAGEFTRRLADGSVGYHTFSLHPVRRDGKVVALEGFLIDATPLRRAQGEYRMLFETMLDGFALHELITDGDGRAVDYRFLAVNPAFERQTGLKAVDIVGRTVREVMPEIEPHWIATYGRVVRTGEPAVFEHFAKPLQRYFEVSAFRPAPGRFACVVVDVTARKQAEQGLAEAHDFHLRILSQAPALICRAGTDGRCDWFNATWLAFTGRTMDQERGDGWAEGVHPDDLSRCLAIYHDSLAARRPFAMEYRLRRHDGEYRWISDNGIPFQTVAGAFGGFIGYCFDVTARRQDEERVREQAALLDVAHDAIMVLDGRGAVTYWNPAAEKIYEIPAAEAIGRKYLELVHREPPVDGDPALQLLFEQGRYSGERQHETRSGKSIDVRMNCTLVRDGAGQPRSALFVVADITEQKRLESQFLRSQRLESVGALASGVAHDLNNVLTPIMMSVDLLRPLAQAPRDRDMLQLLSDSARRGSDIVRQLLLFSRGGESRRVPLSLAPIVRDVSRMMQETFPKNVILAVQSPTDLWPVEADRTQVHQVLLNLCVNARDAMPQGGRLSVAAENVHVDAAFAAAHEHAQPGPYVRLQVADTGCGIAPENLEKIFDPFFTTKPVGQGTGLGLATVLGIARSHGGFLAVRSEVGVGSVFELYLPAAAENAEQIEPGGADVALRGRGECVLVIEDEEGIRSVLERVLASSNYEVLVAVDGADGLAVFAQNSARVKVVLTDVMMPVMDGAQTVRALRRINPDLPVVAVSGLQSHRAEFERNFGPRIRFLPKPFLAQVALKLVREALDEAYPPGS